QNAQNAFNGGTQTTTTNSYIRGLLMSSTDALGKTTYYNYDSNGFLNYIQDLLDNVTNIVNDANGNKLSQQVTRTLPDGTKQTLTTSYLYDGNNRLTKTTFPDGSLTQTFYNAIGKIDHIIDQRQNKTTYLYDDNGNLQETDYPDQTKELRSYD